MKYRNKNEASLINIAQISVNRNFYTEKYHCWQSIKLPNHVICWVNKSPKISFWENFLHNTKPSFDYWQNRNLCKCDDRNAYFTCSVVDIFKFKVIPSSSIKTTSIFNSCISTLPARCWRRLYKTKVKASTHSSRTKSIIFQWLSFFLYSKL